MYEVIRKLICRINYLFNIRLPSDPYISGDTFRDLADIKIDNINDLYTLNSIRHGAIVFCATHVLDSFVTQALPRIKNKFILITHNSDCKIDQKYLSLANHELLIHWFAQNNIIKHKKITSIPIGLENRYYHKNGRISNFNRLGRYRQSQKPKILCSFSLHTNFAEREVALEVLRASGLVDVKYVGTSAYVDLLAGYAFVASPEGNGVDCHRTWEALYLGVIPIVRGNQFYSQFPEFPGLVLNEWEDLLEYDATSLCRAHTVCQRKLLNADFIWMAYWRQMINRTHDLA